MGEQTNYDKRVVVCNYLESTKSCAKGALCYVTRFWHNRNETRVLIVARSRSGRWIHKWENINRLGNFRMKTIPPDHPRYSDLRIEYLATESLLGLLLADRDLR